VYAAADLLICRAGASTVAEIVAVGIPSVMVPLTGAPGDHQTANARSLERAGAAVMVADPELDGARIVAEVDRLLDDPNLLASMEKAAAAVAGADAAGAVVDLIVRHAGRPLPNEGAGHQ
jgi:UDP-N-acetylglucosamine--N-acetylmuramyl-(pentapeptide) pyrophosphoryl-undecaprenol N-acetylglucosamine transferase